MSVQTVGDVIKNVSAGTVLLKGAASGKMLTKYNTKPHALEKYYDYKCPGFYPSIKVLNERLAEPVIIIWVSEK